MDQILSPEACIRCKLAFPLTDSLVNNIRAVKPDKAESLEKIII